MFNFDPKTFEQKEALKNYPHIRVYHDSLSGSNSVMKRYCCSDFTQVLQILKETAFRLNLEHPSLVPIQGYYIQDDDELNIYTKMPFVEGAKTIHQLIDDHQKSYKPIPEEGIVKILYDLASGLDYLHSRNILHQNLKPSNIIIDDNGSARILDMSFSTLVPQEHDLKPVLLESKDDLGDYHAPELHHPDKTNLSKPDLFKTDIWSLGVIVLEMCLLETGIAKSSNQESHLSDVSTRVQEKGEYDPHLIQIIKNMLCVDITQRCTTKEILQNIRENLSQFLTLKQKNYETKSEIIKSIDREFDPLLDESHRVFASFDDEKSQLSSKEEKERDILYFNQSTGTHHYLHLKILVIKSLEENCREVTVSSDGGVVHIKPNNPERTYDQHVEKVLEILQSRMYQIPKGFELDFYDCENITDHSLFSFTSRLQKSLESLNFLKIDLTRCFNITDYGVSELTSRIFPSLEELSLSLYERKSLTSQGLMQLGQNLSRNFPRLQKLSLNLNWCEDITDEGICYLIKSICEKHSSLTYLQLFLSKCKSITSEGFSEISHQITKHLLNLTQLHLDFSESKNLSDDSIFCVESSSPSKIKNLEKFTLNLNRCPQISDQGLENLFVRINRLIFNIKTLDLNFTKCDKITDKGIKICLKAFSSKFKCLKHLKLNFHSCSKLTEESLATINFSLSNDARDLETIFLGFYGCFKFRDQALESLCKNLGKMQKLTDANLDFQQCPNISKDLKSTCRNFFGSKVIFNLK